MDHHWVAKAWLSDVGLPQYSQAFHNHLVDGRMLNSLTRHDLERHLNISKKFHQVSLLLGIELLHSLNFDKEVSGTSQLGHIADCLVRECVSVCMLAIRRIILLVSLLFLVFLLTRVFTGLMSLKFELSTTFVCLTYAWMTLQFYPGIFFPCTCVRFGQIVFFRHCRLAGFSVSTRTWIHWCGRLIGSSNGSKILT